MKKEDILELSRQSNKDEGFEHAENEGLKIGYIIFLLLFMFLAIFNLFYGESGTFHAISSLFWTFSASQSYAKYRFDKSKLYLVGAVAAGIAAILFVINYIITTLR